MSDEALQNLVILFAVIGVFSSVLSIFAALAILFRPQTLGEGQPARSERATFIQQAKEEQETRELLRRWNVPPFVTHGVSSSRPDETLSVHRRTPCRKQP